MKKRFYVIVNLDISKILPGFEEDVKVLEGQKLCCYVADTIESNGYFLKFAVHDGPDGEFYHVPLSSVKSIVEFEGDKFPLGFGGGK